MRNCIGKEVKIKAAGGISSFDDVEELMRLSADRLVKIMETSDNGTGY